MLFRLFCPLSARNILKRAATRRHPRVRKLRNKKLRRAEVLEKAARQRMELLEAQLLAAQKLEVQLLEAQRLEAEQERLLLHGTAPSLHAARVGALRMCSSHASLLVVEKFQNDPSPETFGALHEAADGFLEAAEFSAAQICYQQLIQVNPRDPGLREQLAASLRGEGELHAAAAELHTALQDLSSLDPTSSEAQSWLYMDLGSIIEEIVKVPGTGAQWPVAQWSEATDVAVTVATELTDDGELEEELLTPEDCYRRAIELQPDQGEAYKRLADWFVTLPDGADAAREPFAKAASLMPHDICCATHDFFGRPAARTVAHLPIKCSADEASGGLAGLMADSCAFDGQLGGSRGTDHSVAEVVARFERDGCVVLPGFLSDKHCARLLERVRDVLANEGAHEFDAETRASTRRRHRALPVAEAHDSIDDALARLWPFLSAILQAEHMPLLGCGFMCVREGAKAQELHKDVHGFDRHPRVLDDEGNECLASGGSPRAISIQIQLTDTAGGAATGVAETQTGVDGDEPMLEPMGPGGSLEVLPGSHRPDAACARPETIHAAMGGSFALVPVDVRPGTVSVYSSRLWHRGGANTRADERVFAFLTVAEPDSAAPPGLIHTAAREDVGKWLVGREGLSPRAGS
jgi:tetratricopeptide (TPR) repeat protein